MRIFLRKEFRENEYRVSLIPSDCKKLLDNNFQIYIEKSNKRCFNIDDYINVGCKLVEDITDNCYIIGLKEIGDERYYEYKNIYFSHTFRGQNNLILSRFIEKGGKILDYEYIMDIDGKRLIAFGFWAGYIGAYLGINQLIRKRNNWEDINNLRELNKEIIENLIIEEEIKIAVIGINGRCGTGCKYLLDKLKIDYRGYGRGDDIEDLMDNDIIINRIN